jgi:hypothetical protein
MGERSREVVNLGRNPGEGVNLGRNPGKVTQLKTDSLPLKKC